LFVVYRPIKVMNSSYGYCISTSIGLLLVLAVLFHTIPGELYIDM